MERRTLVWVLLATAAVWWVALIASRGPTRGTTPPPVEPLGKQQALRGTLELQPQGVSDRVVAQVGRSLAGRVIDGRGEGLAGAELRLRAGSGGAVRLASTASDGSFELRECFDGEWILEARLEGHRSARRELVLGPASPPRKEELTLPELMAVRVRVEQRDPLGSTEGTESDVFQGPNALHLVVHERGERAQFVPARAFQRPGGDLIHAAAGQRLELQLRFGSLTLDEVILDPLAPDASVVLWVDPANCLALRSTLRLEVVGAHPGAMLLLAAEDLAAPLRIPLEGQAPLDLTLAPRRWRAALGAPGRAWWMREIDAEPGRALDLGTIRLEPELILQGLVVDEAGQPTGAPLLLERRTQDGWRTFDALGPLHSEATSGSFTIRGLGAGRYRLAAGVGPTVEVEAPRVGILELRFVPDFRGSAGSAPDRR